MVQIKLDQQRQNHTRLNIIIFFANETHSLDVKLKNSINKI